MAYSRARSRLPHALVKLIDHYAEAWIGDPMTDDARTARLRSDLYKAYYQTGLHIEESLYGPHVPITEEEACETCGTLLEAFEAADHAYAAEMRREGARTEHDAMCFTCKPQLPGGCWIRCARGLALSEAERGEAT